MQQPTATLIAVVDDDESLRDALDGLLRATGYRARTFASGGDFLASDGPGQARCLICDIQMPGMCGVELLGQLQARGFDIPVIFISAHPGQRARISTNMPGVVSCLPKPFEAERLLDCIESALHR
ncbi:response regulator transcription factor [Pseudomonas sp. NPDC089406]|uniref:response regulator transcription factor n=1 Tax=Pseudomonas sp. NPDC089406 TaxID=3364463 RepID=UPI00384BD18D